MPEPPVRQYGDVDPLTELLAGATERRELAEVPGKSRATLKRAVIGSQDYVLKRLDLADDWTMRASAACAARRWCSGNAASWPACRAASTSRSSGAAPEQGSCALLMHDVTPWLVPATDEPITLAQHARFLRHMAALHAEFWACGSEFEVVPAMHRYLELSPSMATAEAAAGSPHLVPRLVAKGWPLLAEVAPTAAAVVTPLAHDPGPLVEALAATPQTFVHSNWKLDNLGTDDAERTVVLDWEQPGRGAPLSDLAWYLAIRTAVACRSRRAPRSPCGRRSRRTAWTPDPGGTASSPCACSAPSSSSAGKRRWVVTTRKLAWSHDLGTGGSPARADRRGARGLRRRGGRLGRRTRADVFAAGPCAGGGRAGAAAPAAWCSTWGPAPAWPGGPRWPRGRAGWWRSTFPRACCGASAEGTRSRQRGRAAVP